MVYYVGFELIDVIDLQIFTKMHRIFVYISSFLTDVLS